jgi:hypothetical protein
MNVRLVASCGLALAALALAGCDKGRQDPPEVDVRVVNMAPGFFDLDFRRETLDASATLAYGGIQEFRYDVDSYDFFVFERLLGSGTPRFWGFTPQLQAERAYTFVLAEEAGEIEPIVLENAAAPSGEAQMQAAHAAPGLPAVDLYLERPGVGIAGATPRGTFNSLEKLAPKTLPSGEYEAFVTAAGDPSNVLLATTSMTLPAGVTSTLIVMPASGQPARPSIMLIQPAASVLYDRNVGGELRVINAATDTAPRDAALDGQFSPPAFSAVPFTEPSAYVPLAAGNHTINVTPVANPGVLELNQEVAAFAAQRTTVLFTGPAGTLTHTFVNDDGRRINNAAKLLIGNAASQFTAIDVVLVDPGVDPANAITFEALGMPDFTLGYARLPPGEFDLYFRQPSASTLISGPTRLTLAAGGIYGVLVTDGPDTATITLNYFDDFP